MEASQDEEIDADRTLLGDDFRRFAPWLERALKHRYGARDVEDLVQESFIRLGRYRNAHRRFNPRALLLRIAGNLARDRHRRAVSRGFGRHLPIGSIDEVDAKLSSPPDQHEQLAIKEAILKLPAPLRDVFLLARFTPMTNAEIAERLGISTKTVEWRMGRAMAMCLAELGG